ncbi:hypothetical protein BJ742DRAFT_858505 [Cladochytrium replicatum]|nr:hypothetical protein BJ742DRAFT_858505 [Cladochytrium replicatum]
MDEASYQGQINSLDWWITRELPLKCTKEQIVDGSALWKSSGLELKFTEKSMDEASGNGHVHALEKRLSD